MRVIRTLPTLTSVVSTFSKTVIIAVLLFLLVSCNSGSSGTGAVADAPDEPIKFETQLAVNGAGYIIFEDPQGERLYRRSATVGLDDSGNIVSENYNKLLALNADSEGKVTAGNPVSFKLSIEGVESLEIEETGIVRKTAGGLEIIVGQFLLASFGSPFQLTEDRYC